VILITGIKGMKGMKKKSGNRGLEHLAFNPEFALGISEIIGAALKELKSEIVTTWSKTALTPNSGEGYQRKSR
jgi:hypothetical protein